jgi:predicted ester cyclase
MSALGSVSRLVGARAASSWTSECGAVVLTRSRQFWMALVALAVISACSSSPTENGIVTADYLHKFAADYTAAWCSQRPSEVASFFSESGSLQINEAAPSIGRSSITAAAQGFMTAFPDLVVKMDKLVIDGGRIEYHWTLTGTNSGPGGTGKRVHISGYEQWRFGSDGHILESKGHFDKADYDRQLAAGAS